MDDDLTNHDVNTDQNTSNRNNDVCHNQAALEYSADGLFHPMFLC